MPPTRVPSLSRRQLLGATTTLPWTKHFRHLLPIPKQTLKRRPGQATIKSVRPGDRIKYWNIVPGDQIRLLGDKKNTLHEVLSINRLSNRVFVKGAVNSNQEDNGKLPPSKNYHYSRCQLFLGNYELPPTFANPKPQVVPVFAQRLGTTAPKWNRFFCRYDWQRFATKTLPVIPHLKGNKVSIPWPLPEKRPIPEATSYDTTKETVKKVTYKPPFFSPSMKGLIPKPPLESEFLRFLYNPHLSNTLGDSPPIEVYLYRELANPHSRAKKHSRWLGWQAEKEQRLEQFFKTEMSELRGRSVREARAEAAFKWRRQMEEEKSVLQKQRWKKRTNLAALERRSMRRKRRETKRTQRLTSLALKEEPNQVIPTEV